jgi:hypothetical protein
MDAWPRRSTPPIGARGARDCNGSTRRPARRPAAPFSSPLRSSAALLQKIAGSESQPETPEARFFVKLKSRVVQAYYTSEIGIKQELEYKGNTYLGEFSGVDVSERE